MKSSRNKVPKELKDLQRKLKALTTKWATVLLEEMRKTSKDETIDKYKVYNILNGSIQDKEWHNTFIKSANKVIVRLEKKQVESIV